MAGAYVAGKYVDNKEFYDELKEWIQKRENTGRKIPITENLVKKIMLIVEGYSYKYNFIGYTYRDKMRSEAIYTCIRYADRFNYKKYNNPFAYFTRIAWSAFVKIIIYEKRVHNTKKQLIDRFYFDNVINLQNIDYKPLDDFNHMFASDFNKEHEKFQPVKVIQDGKKMVFKTEEEWKKFTKKSKKERKKREKEKEKQPKTKEKLF